MLAQQYHTSRIGDGEFSDEWSNGRSCLSKQVTSPTGKLDPYLPALPTKKNKITFQSLNNRQSGKTHTKYVRLLEMLVLLDYFNLGNLILIMDL